MVTAFGSATARAAGKHAALVDANRADAACRETLRQQSVGRRFQSVRIVAVAIGRTRTGNDKHHRRSARSRSQHGSLERSVGAGRLDVALHWCGVSRCERRSEHHSGGKHFGGLRCGSLWYRECPSRTSAGNPRRTPVLAPPCASSLASLATADARTSLFRNSFLLVVIAGQWEGFAIAARANAGVFDRGE